MPFFQSNEHAGYHARCPHYLMVEGAHLVDVRRPAFALHDDFVPSFPFFDGMKQNASAVNAAVFALMHICFETGMAQLDRKAFKRKLVVFGLDRAAVQGWLGGFKESDMYCTC